MFSRFQTEYHSNCPTFLKVVYIPCGSARILTHFCQISIHYSLKISSIRKGLLYFIQWICILTPRFTTLASQITVEVFMWHFPASFCIVILANWSITKLSCTTVSIVNYDPVGRLWVKNSAYLLITDGFHSSLVYESEHATAFKAPCSEKQGAFPFLIPIAIICVSTYS